MSKNVKLVGLAGIAGAGKDTFCELYQEVLNKNGVHNKSFAFAHALKVEVSKPILDSFGIDILNCSREEKELVRHILIGWGDARRKQTNGTHWFSKVAREVSKSSGTSIITDVRFKEFEYDEVDWLKANDGILIHIRKYKYDNWMYEKEYYEAQNHLERINDPKLIKMADFNFEWEESSNRDNNLKAVEDFVTSNNLI
jgi:hypothetical protein